jgi:predicted nucleotidyltransferase
MGENRSMTLGQLRSGMRAEILRLAAAYGARNVRVFGSLARGEQSPASDIDFLVDLDPDRSLMDLGGLQMDLQEALRVPVDVSTESMLRPTIRDKALRDAVPL